MYTQLYKSADNRQKLSNINNAVRPHPPRSYHTPASASECVIFVKLWQFDPEDRTQIRLDTTTMPFTPAPGRPGVELIPLFRAGREDVRLKRWAANETISLDTPGGAELLVLEGSFEDREDRFGALATVKSQDASRLIASRAASLELSRSNSQQRSHRNGIESAHLIFKSRTLALRPQKPSVEPVGETPKLETGSLGAGLRQLRVKRYRQ